MFLGDFEESHIDKWFKENLALHLIDSDGKFHSDSVLADYLYYLSLVLQLFALVFYLGCGG